MLEVDLAFSEEGQKSMRTRQIYIPRQQTPFESRNKVGFLVKYIFQGTDGTHDTGKEAGLAFERAASIQTKNLNEPDDAANTLVEAFKTYRKTDPEDAARVLSQAINHYTMKGNFRRAATHQQNLAEVYEVELGDQKRAVEAYETAAGWFESDNAEAYVDPFSPLPY